MPPTDAAGTSQDMILGEMRGQLREVIHSVNNLAQKFEALTREVGALGLLSAELAAAKIGLTAIEVRMVALETDRNRRDGATGMAGAILKSPAIGWLVGAAITAWAVLTGKVQI